MRRGVRPPHGDEYLAGFTGDYQRVWLPLDYALAEALYILDNEKCSGCNLPIWHAMSEDGESVDYETEEHTCYACQFLEGERKKNKTEKPGTSLSVKAVHPNWELGLEGELPDRTAYYTRVAQQAEADRLNPKRKH